MKNDKSDNSKENKLGNRIAIIICIPLIILMGGYFIYHESFVMGKDVFGYIPLIFIFLVLCVFYFLKKRGFSTIAIKLGMIVITAVLFFLFK